MQNLDEHDELYERPLSPILSNNRSYRKIKKTRHKTKSGIIFSDEPDALIQDQQNSLRGTANSAICSKDSNDYIQLNKDSFEKTSQVKQLVECKPVSQKQQENLNMGFQTASGKQLSLHKKSSEFANELFCDFFNPNPTTHREKKYNFLSKKSIRPVSATAKIENTSPVIVVDEVFRGFDDIDCLCSKEKLQCIQKQQSLHKKLLDVIYSRQCGVTEYFHRKFRHNHSKRKLSDVNILDCEHKIKKMDDVEEAEVNIISDISQNINSLESISISSAKNNENDLSINTIRDNISKSNEGFLKKYENSGETIEVRNSRSVFKKDNDSIKYPNSSSTEIIKIINNPDSSKINLDIKEDYGLGLCDLNKSPMFVTASNKKINILSDTILKTQHIFKDILDTKESFLSLEQDIKTKNRKNEPTTSNSDKMEIVSQFSTASGKKIVIPPKSYSKVNSIFTDIPNLEFEKANNVHSGDTPGAEYQSKMKTSFLKVPGKYSHKINELVPIPYSMNERTKAKDDIYENRIVSNFSTASGKKIDVTVNSPDKINQLFKGIIDCNNQTIDNPLGEHANFSTPTLKANDSNRLSSSLKIDNTDSRINQIIETQEENYTTPQRSIPKKKRLGSSMRTEGKLSNTALTKVKSLFGDMNFDDLKLPSHLKFDNCHNSPRLPTPISNKLVSTPHLPNSFTSTPVHSVRRSFIDKNDSLLNDFPQEFSCPLLIQKPTTGDPTSWAEELNRQKLVLEKKLALISKKQEAILLQANSSTPSQENKFGGILVKKTMTLKEIHNLEMKSVHSTTINNVVLQINPQNAALIHFNGNWIDTPTVTTDDGCTLVPNQQGLIGLSEIEAAFKSMPGIQRKLIPDGWIKNHYKWIIWKLASYERFFPSTLEGCFTVSNVVKQLKYRYTKELYNAQRPALRKIYEMDDVPQKRMILCISNIFKNGHKIELELTDGWYSIRTLIDDTLCYQVNNKKIRIGTKLIMSGAELFNCEGCHPLEVDQAQKVRLRIFTNSTRRAAWHSKLGYQRTPLPLIIKLDTAFQSGGVIGGVKVYILRIYPMIYRERVNNSDFWRNQNAEYKAAQDFEINYFREYGCSQVSDGRATNITKRIVNPVLQMTVIDHLSNETKPYEVTIWDATDFHQDQIKEHQLMTFYYLTLSPNGYLYTNKKTIFENSEGDVSKYIQFRRKYVALDNYYKMLSNSAFGEFDTVGLLVKIHVEESNQYFWLTDAEDHFLRVNIHLGPSVCLLLNKVEEGRPVAVSNLKLQKNNGQYVQATGNTHTIITYHPQSKFLREELDKLRSLSQGDIETSLAINEMKINIFENGDPLRSLPNTPDESSLNFSHATTTDTAMSMINIDEVVNRTK